MSILFYKILLYFFKKVAKNEKIMITILLRTIIIYISLTIVLQLMGKRQVGELEISDLVPTLLLSEVAALPIDDTDIPLAHAIIPMLFLFSAEVIITFAKTKWNPLKKIFEGHPVFLIEKGRVNQKALADNRISVEEFLGACRLQGVADISRLFYAILEQDGKLSLLERAKPGEAECGMAHALIIDGSIQEKNGLLLGLSRGDILSLAKGQGYQPEEIFLLQQDDAGAVLCIPKSEGKK